MIVTLEDVVEEIVGEIFDENNSKMLTVFCFLIFIELVFKRVLYLSESYVCLILYKGEVEKKTECIVMRVEGIYYVEANTSIDQLSEDLNIKMREVLISCWRKE